MTRMKLSENFTLKELTNSYVADTYGINNVPNKEQIENLKTLCIELLQPLRDIYKEPFIINSGFRSQELNSHPEIKGASNSQHTKGQAADVKVKDPQRLLKTLLETDLDFDQAILYHTFLHLSYSKDKNRKMVLAAKGVTL